MPMRARRADAVVAALEPDPRRREALLDRTSRVRAEMDRPAQRAAVEDGVGARVLVLRYRDGEGEASRREVEPQVLVRTADHEYLVAWCRTGRRSAGSGWTASSTPR